MLSATIDADKTTSDPCGAFGDIPTWEVFSAGIPFRSRSFLAIA
jgi:hypothetical protein